MFRALNGAVFENVWRKAAANTLFPMGCSSADHLVFHYLVAFISMMTYKNSPEYIGTDSVQDAKDTEDYVHG